MKIAGIIAEYNPFHNGHLHHLKETRRRTGCDAVVVVMSGDFVQRGVPAMTDRFLRAEAALRCGADVVLELPPYGATASAEDFASAGVRALASLRCVSALSYGAEDAVEAVIFRDIASYLLSEPADFKDCLLAMLKEGHSYAKARSLALTRFYPEAADILAKPNNILAVEYEKAVLKGGFAMETIAVPRDDNGYHDTEVAAVCSASAIRSALLRSGRIPMEAVPADVADLYRDITPKTAVFADDFSDMLFAELSGHTPESLSRLYDIPSDLANRILEQSGRPFTWTSLAEDVQCRAYTGSRIDRALCHTLLRMSAADAELVKKHIPYLRVLGARRDAAEVLSLLCERSDTPLLVRFLRDSSALPEDAARLLAADLRASALYSQILYKKSGVRRKDTHRRFLTV